MIKNISNLGDAAVYCDFGSEVNETINTNVINYFDHLSQLIIEKKIDGITNITPSYNKLIVSFDLAKTNSKNISDFLNSIQLKNLNFIQDKKNWIIPICYDFEIDLENMSRELKLDKEEIINLHTNSTFFIYMIGFVPGHPFMGDLDPKLFLNRLKTPRVKIPPGSVGIVEKFCNIYPYESPGGWNIIGRTPIKLFNAKDSVKPSLLSPGDTVKFKSISKKEFNNYINDQ